MALQQIDLDTVQPNNKRGVPGRTAMIIVNQNSTEAEQRLSVLEGEDLATSERIDSLELRATSSEQALLNEKVSRQEADAGLEASLAALRASVSESNLLINPTLSGVNQRRFVGGTLAAGTFGYDRWFAGPGGASVSVSSSGVVTHAAGMVCQVIEAPQHVFGTAICISVSDLSGGNLNVTAGGVAGAITPGTGRRFTTIQVPNGSVSGNLLISLSGDGVTYRQVAVARNDVAASRFDPRPLGQEVLLCQRFYRKSFPYSTSPVNNAGADGAYCVTQVVAAGARQFGWFIPFGFTMRGTPSVTLFNPVADNGNLRNQQNGQDCSSVAVAPYETGFQLNFNTAPSSSPGQANIFHFAANAEITQ